MTEEEKSIVLTVHDIQDNSGVRYVEEGCVKNEAFSFLDNMELSYYFDSSQNKENKDFLYLYSGANVAPSITQADVYFDTFVESFKAGSSISAGKVKFEKVENMLTWGDEKYFSNVVDEDKNIIGNFVAIRYKNINTRFEALGIYFEDSETLMAYLTRVMEAVESYAAKTAK